MLIEGKIRRSTRARSRWTSMLPVPLNSSKITSSMREPVSTRAVAMMLSEPPSSMLRAAPKKRLGRWSALESTPPESTLPEGGTMVLYARARRVMESSRMTTSRLCSTRRLAFSMTISATWTWRAAGSSKVELMTSPPTHRHVQGGEMVIEKAKRSEEQTAELQSHSDLLCPLLLQKKKKKS